MKKLIASMKRLTKLLMSIIVYLYLAENYKFYHNIYCGSPKFSMNNGTSLTVRSPLPFKMAHALLMIV